MNPIRNGQHAARERRFGLLGGTFDPIHVGHLRCAVEIRERFSLERVWLIPAASPPHKTATGASARERLEMVRLAVRDCEELMVSEVELERDGPSYTIDTVRHFQNVLPADSRISLIMGHDAFREIDTWRSGRELLQTVTTIVMSRDTPADIDPGSVARGMAAFLQRRIDLEYRVSPGGERLFRPGMPPIWFAPVTPLAISSTAIRRAIRNGHSIAYLVPETVRRYILKRGLYR